MSGDHTNPRGESLAEQTAKESRAQEARMLPSTGDLTDAQVEHVRNAVNQRCEELTITYEDIDKKIGCGSRAVRRFMTGSYEHSDSNFARRLDRWLKGTEKGEAHMPTEYVSVGVAEKIIGVVKQVYRRRSMGAIVGPSGTSKTTVLKAIEAGLIPNSKHIELTSTDRTISQALRRIATELGLPDKAHAQRQMINIIKELKYTDRLLLLDEVHYLDNRAMNAVRDIHKQTGCPIVLVGTQDLLTTINDFDEFHGQMKSLVSMTYNISREAMITGDPLYTIDDIVKYATAIGIKLDSSGADFVAQLSSTLGWGGLRSAAYLMLNANLLSRGKMVTMKHLNTALREMEGYDGFDRTKTRMHATRKVGAA